MGINKEYLVSVLVASYNPDKEKLFLTIRSILLQKSICFQIVICDDGSQNNYFNELVRYFHEINFQDYVLVNSECNQGTVKNIMTGLKACEGKYVKSISPGDYLYGDEILKCWVEDLEKNNSQISYADAVYYIFEDNHNKKLKEQFTIVKERALPQFLKSFREGGEKNRENYLLAGDVCLGASILVDKNVYLKYLSKIESNVIYCEDYIFRLTEYARVKSSWFEGCPVLYEFGTGISTNKKNIWADKLYCDLIGFYNIFYEVVKSDKGKTDKKIRKKLLLLINSFLIPTIKNKILKYFFIPKAFLFRLKWTYFPRKTPVIYKDVFLKQLFENNK